MKTGVFTYVLASVRHPLNSLRIITFPIQVSTISFLETEQAIVMETDVDIVDVDKKNINVDISLGKKK